MRLVATVRHHPKATINRVLLDTMEENFLFVLPNGRAREITIGIAKMLVVNGLKKREWELSII